MQGILQIRNLWTRSNIQICNYHLHITQKKTDSIFDGRFKNLKMIATSGRSVKPVIGLWQHRGLVVNPLGMYFFSWSLSPDVSLYISHSPRRAIASSLRIPRGSPKRDLWWIKLIK